ncbi:MAG TPA: carbohydrate kinase family protein [Spirochaetia bacterium]
MLKQFFARCIRRFAAYGRTVLSMNENEAHHVCVARGGGSPRSGKVAGRRLRAEGVANAIVIHQDKVSYAWDEEGREASHESFFVAYPTIGTGGGDNFNAGLAAGLTLGLSLDASVLVGNAVAGYYVRNGSSPDAGGLEEFLASDGHHHISASVGQAQKAPAGRHPLNARSEK